MSLGNNELAPRQKVDLFSRLYILSSNGAAYLSLFQHAMPDNTGFDDFSVLVEKMSTGTVTLSSALEMTGYFSQFDNAAIRTGEAGGDISRVFKELANYYATVVTLDRV
ncbi:MAG: type II secretion system F family protein [Enterococcus sp.]|nr:type II secretion system F family protein [Enterococcus sp.]